MSPSVSRWKNRTMGCIVTYYLCHHGYFMPLLRHRHITPLLRCRHQIIITIMFHRSSGGGRTLTSIVHRLAKRLRSWRRCEVLRGLGCRPGCMWCCEFTGLPSFTHYYILQMAFRPGRKAPWASTGRCPGASWVPVRGPGGRRGGPGGPGGALWVSVRVFWRSLGASVCVVKPTRESTQIKLICANSFCCFVGSPGCLAWLPVGPLGSSRVSGEGPSGPRRVSG